MTSRIRTLGLLVAIALVAAACGGGSSEISIASEPFSFTPNLGNTAAYVTIRNDGDVDDVLLAAATDRFGTVELHDVVMEDGSARMVEQEDGIPIPAGSEVVLQPGGLHVMLLDGPETLEVGEEITIDLTFERAGEIQITSVVRDREEGLGDMDMEESGEG